MRNSVLCYLENSVKSFPNKLAIVDEERSITFHEWKSMALCIANSILKRTQKKKVPVFVYLPKSVMTLVSFAGILYSGNYYTPTDVKFPFEKAASIMKCLLPELIITDKKNGKKLIENGVATDKILYVEDVDFSVQHNNSHQLNNQIIDTDLAYVFFTSGSTGVPKGVAITHRSIIDYIDWAGEKFDVTGETKIANQAPFYFDNSILDIYSTIKTGATTYIVPKNLFAQPVLLLEYLKEKKINTIFWVPSALIVVAKLKAFKNVDLSDTLRRVLFCGEVMPNKQLNVWRKFLPDVLYANLYGPTEITDACTYYIIDREFADEEPLPIGKAMPNTDILVLNDKNEPVAGEESGELCVRGTSLSMGYYNNPEKTREAFVQNPLNPCVPELIYRTGDIVKYNEYGELIYLSRKDFQIKHMGHRIELGEIETAVSSLEEISLCCCLYDERRQKIVLFIEGELEKAYINEKISHLVPEYMLPNKLITLEQMPINANGKIDRVKLKEHL